MPSSQPALLSATNIDELQDNLNFILKDLYAFIDIAMRYDGKGVIESLKYGGLGRDISAVAAILGAVGGVSIDVVPLNASGGLTDVTTLNASATAHGFLPKLSDVITQFMSGKGTWIEVPAATLYDANSILKADVDNTPVALTVAEQTLIGRITGGVIDDLTVTQIRTLLGYYRSDASIADDDFVTGPTIVSSSHGTLTICNGGVVEASAEWEMGTSGTVELIRSTTSTVAINVADPGTDGKFNIGIGSTNPPIFKNRLGGARSPLIIVNYN